MPYFRRLTVSMAVISVALAMVVTAVVIAAASAGAAPNGPLLTATPSATPEVTVTPTREFSATLRVTAAHTELQIGEPLTVVVDLDVVEGCVYPVLELTLSQVSGNGPVFSYVSPPDPKVVGPITMPFTYTLQATKPGMTVLRALTFGERYCDDFWNWHYLSAWSDPVFVGISPNRVWLPLLQRP